MSKKIYLTPETGIQSLECSKTTMGFAESGGNAQNAPNIGTNLPVDPNTRPNPAPWRF